MDCGASISAMASLRSRRGRIRPVRPSRRCKPRQQAPDLSDLVLIDSVAHAWIDPFRDRGAKGAEHASSLVHPMNRNVRVDVAAAEKDGGAGEFTGVVARRSLRPDQAAAQAD